MAKEEERNEGKCWRPTMVCGCLAGVWRMLGGVGEGGGLDRPSHNSGPLPGSQIGTGSSGWKCPPRVGLFVTDVSCYISIEYYVTLFT